MTIFIAIVGLGILILVHELGHFVASLSLGMRPSTALTTNRRAFRATRQYAPASGR